ncbi:hypothetical protein RCC89_10975 [Cytophagaceae bacterium ABcell3]|nr:hypothetical protein RCC89_10975 [Cytophagaceae bacterium ABcell3]
MANDNTSIRPFILYSGLVTLVFLLLTRNFGLGIEIDAVHFLYAAQNIPTKFTKPNNDFFIDWPPLYPLVLSIYQLGAPKIPILDFTKYLHLFLILVSGLSSLYLLATFVKEKAYLYLASLVFAFSFPLLLVHIFAWSEPLFITILMLIMVCIVRLQKSTNHLPFCFLLPLIFLLIMQRKSGIMFVPGIALVLLTLPNKAFKTKIIYSGFAALTGVVSYGLWQYYRKKFTGHMFGEAYWDLERLYLNPLETIDQLSTWFLPHQIPAYVRVSTLIVLAFFLYKSNIVKGIFSEVNKSTVLKTALFLSGSYLIVLNLVLVYVHIADDFDDRILAPAYLPIFILLIGMAYLIDQKKFTIKIRNISIPILLVFACWMLYPTMRTAKHIIYLNQDGTGGYNHQTWNKNLVVQKAKTLESGVPIISTDNYALLYQINIKEQNNRDIRFSIPESPFYFIDFFNNSDLPPEIIEKINNLPSRIVYQNKEGKILLISP